MKVIFSIIPKEMKTFRPYYYGRNSQSSGETHQYRCAGTYKPPSWGSSESPASEGFIARDAEREDTEHLVQDRPGVESERRNIAVAPASSL